MNNILRAYIVRLMTTNEPDVYRLYLCLIDSETFTENLVNSSIFSGDINSEEFIDTIVDAFFEYENIAKQDESAVFGGYQILLNSDLSSRIANNYLERSNSQL